MRSLALRGVSCRSVMLRYVCIFVLSSCSNVMDRLTLMRFETQIPITEILVETRLQYPHGVHPYDRNVRRRSLVALIHSRFLVFSVSRSPCMNIGRRCSVFKGDNNVRFLLLGVSTFVALETETLCFLSSDSKASMPPNVSSGASSAEEIEVLLVWNSMNNLKLSCTLVYRTITPKTRNH